MNTFITNSDMSTHAIQVLHSWRKKRERKIRRFPDITGEDNLRVFSYSGRVKSPEWRRQLRRADL